MKRNFLTNREFRKDIRYNGRKYSLQSVFDGTLDSFDYNKVVYDMANGLVDFNYLVQFYNSDGALNDEHNMVVYTQSNIKKD